MEHTQEDEEVKAGGKLTGRQEAMDSCCLCREVGGHRGESHCHSLYLLHKMSALGCLA